MRRGGEQEKDIALALAQKVRDQLARSGVQSRLTRDSDVYVPLDQRINDSLDWGGSVFVSLHLNQDRNRRAQGIDVYAFGRDHWWRFPGRLRHHLPPLPAPPRAQRRSSAELASSLVRELRERGFAVDRPAKARFYVLRNPRMPSVLMELGYLSNAHDAALLASPIYQDHLAAAIARGLRHWAFGPLADRSSLAQAKP